MRPVLVLIVALSVLSLPAEVRAGERLDMPVRGHAMALTIYRPTGPPRGTIVMGSGDVGWVGLAVSRAEELSASGYVVVGINVREYLAAFTSKGGHLQPRDIQADFAELSGFLKARGLLTSPVIVSGVSEGAGIAVVAAAARENHDWISGVITMGLPQLSEIAWRWTDFTSWITKRNADEPSIRATDFLADIAPIPLVMIQSTKDEYVSESDYRAMERAARSPKRQILIPAGNHRFTDRMADLRQAYDDALKWIAAQSRVG
jgi:fermentation-respiration switch protein FrsA (DUF1100 family)